MRRLNVIAGEPHFVDHLAPVWESTPRGLRGIFWVRSDAAARAAQRHRITTRMWTGHVPRGTVLLASSFGDLNAAHKAGARLILMEHGAGQTYLSSHQSYAGGSHPARDAVELFLVPGAIPAAKLRAKHDVPVVEIGCPKLDRRVGHPRRPVSDPPTVVVSFHWDCRVVPETRWAYPYYQRILKRLARRDDIFLMGHAHPRAARHIRPFYDANGIKFIETFDDVLDIADVYAIDNSSSLFEAAACGIPVVVLNAPYYRRDVHHGMRFWEAATIGPSADIASQLPGAIEQALDPSPEQVAETERCLDLVYTHRDGTSAQRAVDAIHTHVLT